MTSKIDNMLGISAPALQLYGKRSVVLANNIANADTPGFRARDMDVPAMLRGDANTETLALQSTRTGHLPAQASGMDFSMQYREVLQASADGNTVDSQKEKVTFTENSLRYRTSLSFLNSRIRALQTVIKGE